MKQNEEPDEYDLIDVLGQGRNAKPFPQAPVGEIQRALLRFRERRCRHNDHQPGSKTILSGLTSRQCRTDGSPA